MGPTWINDVAFGAVRICRARPLGPLDATLDASSPSVARFAAMIALSQHGLRGG